MAPIPNSPAEPQDSPDAYVGLDSDRASCVMFGNPAQVAAVHGVQAQRIHLQPIECSVRESADRIIVMQNGRVTGELPGGPGTTEEQVLALAMVDHLGEAAAPAPELAGVA